MIYADKLKEFGDSGNVFEYFTGASAEDIDFAQKQLGVIFPNQYKQFLASCGMCNYGDTYINGIGDYSGKKIFAIAEVTQMIREKSNLSDGWIVLHYEPDGYLTLLQISDVEVEDTAVYGAEVSFENSEKLCVTHYKKRFDSFVDCFSDFLELGL